MNFQFASLARPTNRTRGQRIRSGLQLTASGLLIAMLSACGGSEGSDPVTIGNPSPTPTASASGSGQVASVDVGTIPVASGDIVQNYKVTNAGLYMSVSYADTNKPNGIIKLRGTPAFSDAWYTAVPISASGSFVEDYAPSNVYSETRTGIGFYWSGYTPENGGKIRWGLHTANTGSPSTFAEENSFGYFGVKRVASGARSGVAASRPWIQWYQPTTVGNNGYKIYQDDGQYTSANTIADRFGTEATPALAGTANIMISHPDKGELYVGSGNVLAVYTATGRTQSWTLPGSGSIIDMMWVDGTLYFSQGGKIYKTTGSSTVTSFADTSAVGSAGGSFCISRGEIFLPNGDAINLQTNAKRNWFKKGTLSTSQSTAAQEIEFALLSSAGIYCSSYAPATTLYVPSASGKTVHVITPIAG